MDSSNSIERIVHHPQIFIKQYFFSWKKKRDKMKMVKLIRLKVYQINIRNLRTVFVTYIFHSLFISSCATFRLIKAFIKKDFLSMPHCLHTADAPILNATLPSYCWCPPFWMPHCLHTADAHHFECHTAFILLSPPFWMPHCLHTAEPTILKYQNGGHQQYEGSVTLKENLSW